jgi:hypothetical protein
MADQQTLIEFTKNLVSDLERGVITANEALTAAYQYAYLREALAAEDDALSQALLAGGEALSQALLAVFARVSRKLADLPSFQSQQPDRPRSEKEIRDISSLRSAALDRVQQRMTSRRREFIHRLVMNYRSRIPTITEAQVDRILASPETVQAPRELLLEVREQQSRDVAVYSSILTHLDTFRPDVFVDVVLNAPPNEPIEQSVLRATRLAGAAHSLEESAGRRGGKLQFFSANATKGMVGGLQKGVDGILSLVGEPIREMILHEKVNGVLRSMLQTTQVFADRLGETFVKSALFTSIAQHLTKQLAEKPSAGQARTVFDDLFSSVFRGPLDPALSRATQEGILDYFELARANAAAPKGRAFLPPGLFPWDIFRTFDFGRVATQGIPAQPRFGFPLLGLGIGSVVGNAFSSFIDRLTSFAFLNPRLPAQLASSRRAAAIPIPLGEDMPLLVAIVVVAVIVLLFVLPTPFNLSQLSHSSKVSALLAALQQTKDIGAGIIQATTFRCEWSGPTPPKASISTCAVHAPITQGPFNPSGSHRTLNAYDFGASLGTPVVSGHDAYVASYDNSYAPEQYRYGSYGNNVVLVATDPSTNTQYCTNYAHLADVAPIVVASSGQPALIPAGTVVGFVDTTGYTYGCDSRGCGEGHGVHLHWGYKGPNQTTPFLLPAGCP